MARRKKEDSEVEAQAGTPKEKNGGVIKLPSEGVLKKLISHARKAKSDTGEINGDFGAAVKAAVDNHGLHKKAFAICKSLDRLEPEVLSDTLAHLDDYLVKTGLRKRADSVMRMPLEGEDEPRARAANVRDFPAPRGEAAE